MLTSWQYFVMTFFVSSRVLSCMFSDAASWRIWFVDVCAGQSPVNHEAMIPVYGFSYNRKHCFESTGLPWKSITAILLKFGLGVSPFFWMVVRLPGFILKYSFFFDSLGRQRPLACQGGKEKSNTQWYTLEFLQLIVLEMVQEIQLENQPGIYL